MTAPVVTARQNPLDAKMLEDGFRIKITLSEKPDVAFWDKSVTPPGVVGGDAIDITTMFNNAVRTKAPRQLYELTDTSLTVAWDPKMYDQIKTLVNLKQTITVTFFARLKQIAFYGFLQSFEPQEFQEGSQPEAQITIVATNVDPVTGAEENYVVQDLVI